jgi:hypothetical protein
MSQYHYFRVFLYGIYFFPNKLTPSAQTRNLSKLMVIYPAGLFEVIVVGIMKSSGM